MEEDDLTEHIDDLYIKPMPVRTYIVKARVVSIVEAKPSVDIKEIDILD